MCQSMKNSLLGISACQKPAVMGQKDQFQDIFFIGATVNLGQVNGTELNFNQAMSPSDQNPEY